jgi:hypothetical protein
MDWIDRERDLRQCGARTALTQSQHAEANARYPGLTIQICEHCGEPTGKGEGLAVCSECESLFEKEYGADWYESLCEIPQETDE